jgi:hypothetical protein
MKCDRAARFALRSARMRFALMCRRCSQFSRRCLPFGRSAEAGPEAGARRAGRAGAGAGALLVSRVVRMIILVA